MDDDTCKLKIKKVKASSVEAKTWMPSRLTVNAWQFSMYSSKQC